MKFTKTFFIGFGGFALAALLLTMLAPKAAHAVVATLVQVANTSANPVPNLDTERAARIPYQSFVTVTTCSGLNWSYFSFTDAPSGYRLVVENVSGYFYVVSGTTVPPVGRLINSGALKGVWGIPGALGTNFGATHAGLNGNITAYFNPGDGPALGVMVNMAASPYEQTATLSGYLENCAVTGCPAIQR